MGVVVVAALARVSAARSAGPPLRPAVPTYRWRLGCGKFDRAAVAQMGAVFATPPAVVLATSVDTAWIAAGPFRLTLRVIRRWRGRPQRIGPYRCHTFTITDGRGSPELRSKDHATAIPTVRSGYELRRSAPFGYTMREMPAGDRRSLLMDVTCPSVPSLTCCNRSSAPIRPLRMTLQRDDVRGPLCAHARSDRRTRSSGPPAGPCRHHQVRAVPCRARNSLTPATRSSMPITRPVAERAGGLG